MTIFLILPTLLISLTRLTATLNVPLVETPNGKIEGFNRKIGDDLIDVFLGIPYAQNPTGNLRFKPPVPVESWKKTHQAKSWPPPCPHTPLREKETAMLLNHEMTEDCLFLNVWVPNPIPKVISTVVFIHGGAFACGSASMGIYDGSILCAQEKLVVVTINYRTNAFGFLYLDEDLAPGNVGLQDQTLALKWVYENIKYFGGDDARNITIMGQSAGASSVGFHLLDPNTRNYFNRAVLMSGSAATIWSTESKEAARRRSLNYAKVVGCDFQDLVEVKDCLLSKDVESLVDGLKQLRKPGAFQRRHFIPVIQDQHPTKVLLSDAIRINKDVIIGVTVDDGAFLPVLAGLFQDTSLLTRETFYDVAKIILGDMYESVSNDLSRLYLDCEGNNHITVHDALVKLSTDVLFACSAEYLAQHMSLGKGYVYYYQFHHRPSNSPWPDWLEAVHGDDINFLFGHALNDSLGYTEDEKFISQKCASFLGNFARTGNPNGENASTTWFQYEMRNQLRLNIQSEIQIGSGSVRSYHCPYWINQFVRNLD